MYNKRDNKMVGSRTTNPTTRLQATKHLALILSNDTTTLATSRITCLIVPPAGAKCHILILSMVWLHDRGQSCNTQ